MLSEAQNEDFGLYEAECQGCDIYTRVDDLGLCEACADKLDRDLIRQRDWEYSATAFVVPREKREELRAAIIREYGQDLELIAPRDPGKSRQRPRKRKAKHKKRSNRR